VVESTALEMRHTGNRIGGSNPSLSASQFGLPPETASEGIWTAIEVQTSIEPLMREAQPNSKVLMP
jgi:hypothetical protein